MRSKIKTLIDKSNSILLLTHVDPDGDAVGSVLAFYHYLTAINKSVDMVLLDIPKVFNFLSSINKVCDTSDKNYDLGIVLDCATKERIGQKDDLLSKCNYTIAIDHHVSNTSYCDLNLIDGSSPACCQVVYYLFDDWNVSISNEIGESLITGILTDTNGFSISNVTSETFSLAAKFCNLGIDIYSIYDKVLCRKSMAQYNLMKIAMDRLEFLDCNKIAFTYILKDDFEMVGAITGDHEGIVNIGRNIDGVEVSILIRENNGWTISLRSTGHVDVSKIAFAIGGAGHIMAAGGKLTGSFDEVKERVINETKRIMLGK